jgi:aromatic-L-amino-acid decarboxylase
LKFYRTREGHGCHQKAIELLGIGSEHLRSVEHDRSLRMIPSALDAAIREDRQRGDIPIAVIANAGTVNSGAIDPLDEIADVCARHKVWLHVDGAYGAPAILTGRYAKQLSALARADSIALEVALCSGRSRGRPRAGRPAHARHVQPCSAVPADGR